MKKLIKNMDDLRILAIHHDTPDVKSYTTVLFERILPILKSRKKIHMTWLIHKNENFKRKQITLEDTAILDIHDFNNAVEVIQKVKPNLVYVIPGLSAPDYALALAAKYFGIPTIGGEIGIVFVSKNIPSQFFKSKITQFFQSSTSLDNPEKMQLMGKGRFFIHKHIFLVKTMIAVKQNQLKIIKEMFSLFRMYLFTSDKVNSRFWKKFSVDLHFLDGEIMIKPLLDAGFKKSSLIVTGNPIHDKIFQELQDSKYSHIESNEKKVLLITAHMVGLEHDWVKTKRDHMIKEIINTIKNNEENIKLSVKIHPSNDSLDEYNKLIHKIDPSIMIYQKESILQLIKESDVIISTSSSTAMVCGLLSKKPLIIHNCFQVEHDELLERGLVIECKQPSDIISSIHTAINSEPPTEKIEKFIKDTLFKSDGQSAERISDAIVNLLDNNIQQSN